MSYIDEHRDRFGVEPICRVLTEHGMAIAPSGYYAHRNRAASARTLRDEQLKAEISRIHQDNYGVYGVRKVWRQLQRDNVAVARCTVERLMKDLELQGVRRGKRIRTTIPDETAPRSADLVKRNFDPPAPNMLWVADFTYCQTWSGTVYVAFVIDAYARRIVGWKADTSMKTPLVLDTLDMAIWSRGRDGISDLTGLIHHSDAGSQYVSIAFTERLIEAGVDPSVGSVGDAYDNSLAETTIGLFKTELFKRKGPWKTMAQLEFAVAEYVDWFNNHRLHSACGYIPPAEYETLYYATNTTADSGGIQQLQPL